MGEESPHPPHRGEKEPLVSQKAIISVLCVLVAVDVVVHLSAQLRGAPLREADAQAVATPTSQIAVATVQGPASEPWVYFYDVASQRLACYMTKGQGIELKGVRQLTWDLMIPELPPDLCNKRLTVKQVKELVK